MTFEEEIWLYVTEQFAAIHSWKKASMGIAFLKHPHRHIFHVKLEIEQKHLGREIEFFTLKKELTEFVRTEYENQVFSKSCETIAYEIMEHFFNTYSRSMKVTVSEDNENGAYITKMKKGDK